MTAEEFDDDAEEAFVGSVAASSNGTLSEADVIVTNVTDVNTTGSTSRRMLLAAPLSAVKVSYIVSVIIEELGIEVESAFAVLQEIMSTGVESSAMEASFNSILEQVKVDKGENFTAVFFQDLVINEEDSVLTVLETARPTSAPTGSQDGGGDAGSEDTMILLLSVAVVLLFIAMVGVFIYMNHRAKRAAAVSDYTVVKVDVDV